MLGIQVLLLCLSLTLGAILGKKLPETISRFQVVGQYCSLTFEGIPSTELLSILSKHKVKGILCTYI